MIPKASQRAGGQDLATHLLNAHDNEYVELAEVRGAVASDLHGAFAEWEAIAHNLTKCQNYLYSLSVNPDLGQGQLSRDQYRDYAQRVEEAMGLAGQPRAMIYHIKNGREHCHIVWSRIDAQAGKAIHQAFDHEKLMMVTREFARDHGLTLPAGYERGGDDRKRKSLYEMQQQRNSGVTKEERMAAVCRRSIWRLSQKADQLCRTRRRIVTVSVIMPMMIIVMTSGLVMAACMINSGMPAIMVLMIVVAAALCAMRLAMPRGMEMKRLGAIVRSAVKAAAIAAPAVTTRRAAESALVHGRGISMCRRSSLPPSIHQSRRTCPNRIGQSYRSPMSSGKLRGIEMRRMPIAVLVDGG